MRPIKLSIDGLNSFETKQVLDFSELAGGVFGIFGKTGSGKSTILDAITLALYGKVERTKQNVDFVNTKCSKAVVSFEFEIFISGENKRYEITRIFSKKKNGKDLDASAELYQIEGDEKKLVEEGQTKVNDKIFGIIGLGVNEFEKCIALPQGEFSAFLKAKPSERTEIMSNIFNLSRYGETLANNVKAKLNEFDKEVSVLTASSEMVEYATDEKVVEAKSALDETKSVYDEKSNTLKETSETWAKLKQTHEKLETLKSLKEELVALENSKADIEKLQKEITKSQIANILKSDYNKMKKDETDIKELTEKLSSLNELKLQKQSNLTEAENEYNNLKSIYDSKMLEFNAKIARLQEITHYDEEIKTCTEKRIEAEEQIKLKEKEKAEETENNSYLEADISKLQEQIDVIDEFINSNKADVELTYALEQTKGIESELMLIDDMYKKVEALIDQTNEDLKTVQAEYNESINQERALQQQREKIENSIGVAFEDVDTTPFNKLRSCDKQIDGMNEVKNSIARVDELIAKLSFDNETKVNIINQVESEIYSNQQSLANIESMIAKKEVELTSFQTEREEMLGENVISMISEHLQIGDNCPVCTTKVTQKIYSEKNDLGFIEGEIERCKTELKNLRFERDKVFASMVSLKTRAEFERSQIENNNIEIKVLHDSKNSLYQRYVDNNDASPDNFEKLYNLIESTIDSLEELIELQDRVRIEEGYALVRKTQAGTKITIYKAYTESLIDMLYDLQKKKAEREFVIMNVHEKYTNLAEFKKQIAEGKNIEIAIDSKKEERASLKDKQFELMTEKSKSDLKIASISADIALLEEKVLNFNKTIADAKTKMLSSGVPDGVMVAEEQKETENAITELTSLYTEKQALYETRKEELSRVENDYAVSNSILTTKEKDFKTLTAKVNQSLELNEFSSYEDLESCFADSSILKLKQEKVNGYNDSHRVLKSQIDSIESEKLEPVDEIKIKELEVQIDALNEEVKSLTESVGKLGAEYERIASDNIKLKEFTSNLAESKRQYDLAKELSSVLRGKALAEYICEDYLQRITESANQKLEILMDGRYTLRFENKEFYVEDNFNDGKTRPANTLSGGETFIVSLSLALSISDAIAMLSSRSMDFFFLDEGFGTLDNELCSVVVNSLYKLESQNLKIGLISHVVELEESIKNKVVVTKDNNGTKLKVEHSL